MIHMSNAFVIQIHSGCGPVHYDLMLERGQRLATWQLPKSPAEVRPAQSVPARKLKDHRSSKDATRIA